MVRDEIRQGRPWAPCQELGRTWSSPLASTCPGVLPLQFPGLWPEVATGQPPELPFILPVCSEKVSPPRRVHRPPALLAPELPEAAPHQCSLLGVGLVTGHSSRLSPRVAFPVFTAAQHAMTFPCMDGSGFGH